MRKKLLLALAIVVGLILILAVVVALQPADFSIARSATVKAPPEQVFPHVKNLQKWQAWSPWAKLDPNAKNSFEGPVEGDGAKFHWDGNDEVGAGTMTILTSQPSKLVEIELYFSRPFEDTATTQFAFQPQGEETLVHWTMTGKNNFIAKAMCLFMDMDKMVGGSFEEGLANLKQVVEAHPATDGLETKPTENEPMIESKPSVNPEEPNQPNLEQPS